MKIALFVFLGLHFIGAEDASSGDSPWIRPGDPKGALVWGRRDGIVFGLPSPGGMPGPRGLIRVGIYDRNTGRPLLINFIAFEPVVGGKKGFSELEMSSLDGARGKRLWVEGPVPGSISNIESREELKVVVACEKFRNGARVSAEICLRSDRPEEIIFSVRAEPESAPIQEATLTATMGNYERLRCLWLENRMVSSKALYRGYQGNGFVEKDPYPLGELARSAEGDVWIAATSDEENPAQVPIPDKPWWQYKGPRLTQYWRVPGDSVERDLRVRVNGRRVYWASRREIPGGISFENFEIRQSYRPGQRSIFGLTRKGPRELPPWKNTKKPPQPQRKRV